LTFKVQKSRERLANLIYKKEGSGAEVSSRQFEYQNREGLLNYDFSLSGKEKQPGLSAMLRIKNEEDRIFYCLTSILDVFDEIVLVDNASEDQTVAVVREFKRRFDTENKIKCYFYPFTVSRYGPEHFDTPEDSVHSVVYYYNWTLSLCTRTFVCKWDGDMVLSSAARPWLLKLLREIQANPKACWVLYGQTVYRDGAGNFYQGKDDIHSEIRVFPNGGNPRFGKQKHYEALKSDPPLEIERPDKRVAFYELKFTDVDEFSHWSVADIPTTRKQREQRYFNLVKSGQVHEGQFQKLPSSFLDDQIPSRQARRGS